MRTARTIGSIVLVAGFVCGCSVLRTEKLKVGMTEQQLNDLYGKPTAIYSRKQGASLVQVIDYSKESLGIPNYLDDYGWFKYPTTRVVRAWFIDGNLAAWFGDSYSSYESLKKLERKSEFHVPPSFDSAAVPEPVRKLQSQGK